MNKPITVERREFAEAIVKVCNDSCLPAFVKVDVIERALNELKNIADNELRRDQAQYMAMLRAEQEKQETEEGEPNDQHDV